MGRHGLGLISLKLSNMSVVDLCETHCQQLPEFFLALMFTQIQIPPVPTYMAKNGLCTFGYCFPGSRLLRSFGKTTL